MMRASPLRTNDRCQAHLSLCIPNVRLLHVLFGYTRILRFERVSLTCAHGSVCVCMCVYIVPRLNAVGRNSAGFYSSDLLTLLLLLYKLIVVYNVWSRLHVVNWRVGMYAESHA